MPIIMGIPEGIAQAKGAEKSGVFHVCNISK